MLNRPAVRIEIVLLLGVSLGRSAILSIVAIIDRLTYTTPLAEQTATLNPSVTPDRPWLDLTYQLVYIGLGFVAPMRAV